MNIIGFQWNPVWQDTQANLQALNSALESLFEKTDSDIDVVVLPEVFLSGFSMQPSLFAEELGGPSIQSLKSYAQLYKCYLIAGVAIQANEQVFNSALVISPLGGLLANYQKQKLFAYADEHKSYKAGKIPAVFKINEINCAVFVCYDLRFPELFRQVAKDIEVIFVIASWPESRQSHWEALLKARAIENQCFIVGVNRIGTDGNNRQYAGGSMIISPLGEQLAYGGKTDQQINAIIEPEQTLQVRQQFPFLVDM